MKALSWSTWSEDKPKVHWIDHSKCLWVKCSYKFHPGCLKEMLWRVSDFEIDFIQVYVLIQKYFELYGYYKISLIDKSIYAELNDFMTNLVQIKENSGFKIGEIENRYWRFTHIPHSFVKDIELLKHKIEISSTISRLHSFIMNQKMQDYINNSKFILKDYSKIVYELRLIDDSKSKAYPKAKIWDAYPIRDLIKKFDDDIINHWNRNIVEKLKRKDIEIIQIKEEYEAKLIKVSEDKDLFHKTQLELYKKEKTVEINFRMENIHKELDYVRSSHLKEKHELEQEIKDLKSKLQTLSKNKEEQENKNFVTKTDNPCDQSEESKNSNKSDITIDLSNKDDLLRI